MKIVPYIKHLVECSCVLPKYKHIEPMVWHQFVVFSELNKETGAVLPSFAQCNNCGAIHKVLEIGVSNVIKNQKVDSIQGLVTIEDVKENIPEKLVEILEKYKCPLSTYQEVQYLLENQLWGIPVILTRDEVDGSIVGKYIQIIGSSLWKVVNFLEEHSDTINV